VKAIFQEELRKPEWSAGWSNGRQLMSESVKTWLSENSDKLLATTLQELFGHVAQSIVNRLQHP
jgi:hypothetical protein